MYLLYIFALLIHAALSTTPCQDGKVIVSRETNNPIDLIGNWTIVYRWDDQWTNPQLSREFLDVTSDQLLDCSVDYSISAASVDFIESKEAECKRTSGYREIFEWSDARLRLHDSSYDSDGVVFFGENENFLMRDCRGTEPMVFYKVSDDFMVLYYPKAFYVLMTRKALTWNELKCIVNNVDIGKGLKGFPLC